MNVFGVLNLLGGLALFLLGMNLMGSSLEKRAGGGLKKLLARLTSSPAKGLLLGLGVTAVIQSSSATTVMVVGFVNSGILSLRQAISVIMGANVGTTVTSWLLSLTGIESTNLFVQLLKPSSFTPVLAVIGIAMYMMPKNDRRRDTGMILLGFSVLMYGMEMMSGAVAPLRESERFVSILTLFSNPVLGVLAGAVLTAVIQSSSASVGILQAISSTGSLTFGSAIPIILGQNIGTCVTALLSSIGANNNARRAAMVHLYFNIIGTVVLLIVYLALNALFNFAFTASPINQLGIAIVHSSFNILSTMLLFPFARQLERLACATVREGGKKSTRLDERLFVTPAVALDQARAVTQQMAHVASDSLLDSLKLIDIYDPRLADKVAQGEKLTDEYEDMLGDYLVKLSSRSMSETDSRSLSGILHVINDFERIGDHALNIMESAREMHDKSISFSGVAKRELAVAISAVQETLSLATDAFDTGNAREASQVEPMEEVVDALQKQIRARHIARLTKGECTIELGFVLTDILGNLERVSDHASNIAVSVLDQARGDFDDHAYLGEVKSAHQESFEQQYKAGLAKYRLEA